MRAYQITEFTGPLGVSLVDVPEPVAGPGHVVVRVRAVSLNYRDLVVARGRYSSKPRHGIVPVSDGAGEVVSLGLGVTRVKLGDRVAASFFAGWHSGGVSAEKIRSDRGGSVDGMLAEYVVVDAESLVLVPDHLSFDEAACLPCAAVTAWAALVENGGIKAGESVLTLGTGGVSMFALQFAKLHGARVIATSSNDAKLDRAKALGADEGINYATTPAWEARVRELTAGRGVDHVIEVGGMGTLEKSIRAARVGGHVSLIGVLAAGGAVNPMQVLFKSIRLIGVYVASRETFEAMNDALRTSGLRPVIDRVFGFDDVVAAYQHLEAGAHFGKVVIRVAE